MAGKYFPYPEGVASKQESAMKNPPRSARRTRRKNRIAPRHLRELRVLRGGLNHSKQPHDYLKNGEKLLKLISCLFKRLPLALPVLLVGDAP